MFLVTADPEAELGHDVRDVEVAKGDTEAGRRSSVEVAVDHGRIQMRVDVLDSDPPVGGGANRQQNEGDQRYDGANKRIDLDHINECRARGVLVLKRKQRSFI